MPGAAFRPPRLSWRVSPAALGAVTLVGAALWAGRPTGGPADSAARRGEGSLPDRSPVAAMYSVTRGVENGVPVVLVQVVPGGDVLVVDGVTGRLLEARPAGSRPKPGRAGTKTFQVE